MPAQEAARPPAGDRGSGTGDVHVRLSGDCSICQCHHRRRVPAAVEFPQCDQATARQTVGPVESTGGAMNQVLLGAIIAATSGIATKLLDHFLSPESRKREMRAERQLDATEEAYWRMKVIESMVVPATASDLQAGMVANDEWFFRHCMYFPAEFNDAWMTLRNRVFLLYQRERIETKLDGRVAEILDLQQEVGHWAGECLHRLNVSLKKPELRVIPWTKPSTAGGD